MIQHPADVWASLPGDAVARTVPNEDGTHTVVIELDTSTDPDDAAELAAYWAAEFTAAGLPTLHTPNPED